MKYITLLLAIALFTSCKKCHQCLITSYNTKNGIGYGQSIISNTEFCGTDKQTKNYEAAGTNTTRSGAYTVVTRTRCK